MEYSQLNIGAQIVPHLGPKLATVGIQPGVHGGLLVTASIVQVGQAQWLAAQRAVLSLGHRLHDARRAAGKQALTDQSEGQLRAAVGCWHELGGWLLPLDRNSHAHGAGEGREWGSRPTLQHDRLCDAVQGSIRAAVGLQAGFISVITTFSLCQSSLAAKLIHGVQPA